MSGWRRGCNPPAVRAGRGLPLAPLRPTPRTSRRLLVEEGLPEGEVPRGPRPWLGVLGELFQGQTLPQYFGGIGQGVKTPALKALSEEGFDFLL